MAPGGADLSGPARDRLAHHVSQITDRPELTVGRHRHRQPGP